MPKLSPASGFPCNPEDCHASRHLDGPDYKIWDLMMATAKKNERDERLFFASVRPYLVNAANQSATAIDATLDRLEGAGWIKNLARRDAQGKPIVERKENGEAKPHVYRVLNHEEWISEHPWSCPNYKLAPNFEEAKKYGVSKGDKISTAALPKNFWPGDLRSALDKVTGEEFSIVTDDETAALAKHTKEVVATLGGHEAVAALGAPELVITAPAPVDRNWPAHGAPELAAHGRPELARSRSTGRNPIQPILENTSHTPASDAPTVTTLAEEKAAHSAENRVCVLSDEEANCEVDSLLKEFLNVNEGEIVGACTTNNRREMRALAKPSREKFRAAARVWLREKPWNSSTTHPFSTFIANFVVYEKKPALNKQRQQSQEDKERIYKRVSEFHRRKAVVNYEGKLTAEFLATLTDADRTYIRDVIEAKTLEEMPPDNGKNYVHLDIDWRNAKREEERASADLF